MKIEHHFEWSGIRKEIKDSAIWIGKSGSYDCAMTGYSNTESGQYKRIKWLKSNIKKDEAHLLINYPSAVVQAIVFDKLIQRKDSAALTFYFQHQNDSSEFYEHCGCVGATWKLNDYMNYSVFTRMYFYPDSDSNFFKSFGVTSFKYP